MGEFTESTNEANGGAQINHTFQDDAADKMSPHAGDEGTLEENEVIINFTSDDKEDLKVHIPMHVAFNNLMVKSPSAEKYILNDISGQIKPGELLAIMGPSGAGKTTLLNLIAGRMKSLSGGEFTGGDITINGEKATKRQRRRTGYVLQSDTFFAHLSVKQTLNFAGELRLSDSIPKAEKYQKVQNLMQTLGLKKCEDTVMGGGMFVKGISGGERKRTSIAVEMITNPSLLLMDEPTSGLDAATSRSLVQTLKTLARQQNRAIVATIHQPSSHTFHMFDKLMLLCNGQVAFFGDTSDCVRFFDEIGMPCYPNWNPADYVMEKLTAGPETEQKVIDGFKSWNTRTERYVSTLSAAVKMTNGFKNAHDASDDESVDGSPKQRKVEMSATESRVEIAGATNKASKAAKWPTTFWTQFRVLAGRAFIETKSELWDKIGFIQTLALSVIIGLIWWDTPHKEESLQDKMGVLFFICLYLSFNPIFVALMTFPQERNVIAKERAAGMYRLSAYFGAKCVSELPLVVFQPVLLHFIVYWMSGMNRSVYYLGSLATIFITVLFGQSLGLFLGALVKDFKKSITCAVVFGISSSLVGGFYARNMPHWISWIKYFSWLTYAFNAMLRLEFFHNDVLTSCATHNSVFEKCTAAVLNSTQLAINLANNVTVPAVHITGTDIYDMYATISLDIGTSLFVLIAGIVALRTGCYLGLRYCNKPR